MMDEQLTSAEIELILESLEYSRMKITHGSAPNEVKRPKVEQIDAVLTKLRSVRKGAILRLLPSL